MLHDNEPWISGHCGAGDLPKDALFFNSALQPWISAGADRALYQIFRIPLNLLPVSASPQKENAGKEEDTTNTKECNDGTKSTSSREAVSISSLELSSVGPLTPQKSNHSSQRACRPRAFEPAMDFFVPESTTRSFSELHAERSYLLNTLQQQTRQATDILRKIPPLEEKLLQDHPSNIRRRVKKQIAWLKHSLDETTSQEQAILARLGQLILELQCRDRLAQIEDEQRQAMFFNPITLPPLQHPFPRPAEYALNYMMPSNCFSNAQSMSPTQLSATSPIFQPRGDFSSDPSYPFSPLGLFTPTSPPCRHFPFPQYIPPPYTHSDWQSPPSNFQNEPSHTDLTPLLNSSPKPEILRPDTNPIISPSPDSLEENRDMLGPEISAEIHSRRSSLLPLPVVSNRRLGSLDTGAVNLQGGKGDSGDLLSVPSVGPDIRRQSLPALPGLSSIWALSLKEQKAVSEMGDGEEGVEKEKVV